MIIEKNIKKDKTIHKKSNNSIHRLMIKLIKTFTKICIRHTFESQWYNKLIKKSIFHTNVDFIIFFSFQYLSMFKNFDQQIRQQLQTNLTTSNKQKNENKINTIRLLSFARLFRIVSNLSFMIKFWKMSQYTHIQFTNKDMKI